MNRFLIFPSLFAAWLFAAQFGWIVLEKLSFWLTLRLVTLNSSVARVHLNIFPLSNWWSSPLSIRACAIGAAIGVVFAFLDLKSNRGNTKTQEVLFRLLPNLLKSGAIAGAFILLYYGALKIPVQIHLSRTPYPPYSPYRSLSKWGIWLPPLLLLAALVWAIAKTLRSPVSQISPT